MGMSRQVIAKTSLGVFGSNEGGLGVGEYLENFMTSSVTWIKVELVNPDRRSIATMKIRYRAENAGEF